MASVTGPGFPATPSAAAGRPRRRTVLIGVVVLWIFVVAGLAIWSVGHQQPTVPEQRDIDQALPKLQQAAGVAFAAAGGPGRAVTLGELALSEGCQVTPVRAGVEATRDITIQVRDGEARAALEAVAANLPAGYQPDVVTNRTGKNVSLHADAGNFIGIDSDAAVSARDVTVSVSTGCRPHGSQAPASADPAADQPPVVLESVLRALGATHEKAPAVRAVMCPDGGSAGTYEVDGLPAPVSLPERLKFLNVTDVVRSDEDVRAYRTGGDSVVVVQDEQQVRVSVSTSCQ
jgi:hypothetical protein